jgi:hypothetical protein
METSISFKDLNKYSKSTNNSIVRKPLIVRNSQLLKPRKLEGVFILKRDLHLVKLLKKANQRQTSSIGMGTALPDGFNSTRCSFVQSSICSPDRSMNRESNIKSRISIRELNPGLVHNMLPKLVVYSNYETIDRQISKRGKKLLKRFSGTQINLLGNNTLNRSKNRVRNPTIKEFSTILNPS